MENHCRWLREHIKRYPGHESLWCHMRFCAYMAAARKVLELTTEPAFIEEVLKACKDSDVEDESILKQRQLVLRYGLWITHMVSTKFHTNANRYFNLPIALKQIDHYALGDGDLRTWAQLTMDMHTKELEKLADQSTFYKLFPGWSCYATERQKAIERKQETQEAIAMRLQATSSMYCERASGHGDNVA